MKRPDKGIELHIMARVAAILCPWNSAGITIWRNVAAKTLNRAEVAAGNDTKTISIGILSISQNIPKIIQVAAPTTDRKKNITPKLLIVLLIAAIGANALVKALAEYTIAIVDTESPIILERKINNSVSTAVNVITDIKLYISSILISRFCIEILNPSNMFGLFLSIIGNEYSDLDLVTRNITMAVKKETPTPMYANFLYPKYSITWPVPMTVNAETNAPVANKAAVAF